MNSVGIVTKTKNKISSANKMLINMELRNGMHRQFFTFTQEPIFRFMKGCYVIDGDLKYYNVDAKCFALDYHQDFTLPIKRQLPASNIKKAIESSGTVEVENSTNPLTLENLIISKIAEGVMKGRQIDEFFKQIKLMLIITMIAAVIHLLLFINASGVLKDMKIPFL